VVATVPLTRDETWVHGVPGELWVFRGGALRATLTSS
jgi:glutamine amidotransferase